MIDKNILPRFTVEGFGTFYGVGGRVSLSRSLTVYKRNVEEVPWPPIDIVCDREWHRPPGTYIAGSEGRETVIIIRLLDRDDKTESVAPIESREVVRK